LTFRKGKIIKREVDLTGRKTEHKYKSLPNFECFMCSSSYFDVKLLNINKVNDISAAYASLENCLEEEEKVKAGYYIAKTFVTQFRKAARSFLLEVLESSDLTPIKCQDMLSSL
jgi:hypothetical protein